LTAFDDRGVTFRWKDYRAKGRTKYKTMTLAAGEFIRRFLLHVLPTGLHRIRHYGLLANAGRKESLALTRELLKVPAPPPAESDQAAAATPTFVCRHCGAPMIVIEMLPRPRHIRAPPPTP
jgi:Putative transposase